ESVAGPLDGWPRAPRAHALQARVYAENPLLDFRPATGTLSRADFPDALPGVRVETWVEKRVEVTPHYDPMLAKIIARGPDRASALATLRAALAATRLEGAATNVDYLAAVAASEEFARGAPDTGFLGRFRHAPAALEVIEAGPHATIQDW